MNGTTKLYSNTRFAVVAEPATVTDAVGGLPVPLGNKVIRMDGYNVHNLLTGQVDGEFRSYAIACAHAREWNNMLEQMDLVDSQAARIPPGTMNYDH